MWLSGCCCEVTPFIEVAPKRRWVFYECFSVECVTEQGDAVLGFGRGRILADGIRGGCRHLVCGPLQNIICSHETILCV
jgi:hypothetical protein